MHPLGAVGRVLRGQGGVQHRPTCAGDREFVRSGGQQAFQRQRRLGLRPDRADQDLNDGAAHCAHPSVDAAAGVDGGFHARCGSLQ